MEHEKGFILYEMVTTAFIAVTGRGRDVSLNN